MKAIPVTWLIHAATLHTPTRDDYGAETDGPGVELRNVRFEPTSRTIIDKNGMQVQCALTMFVDMRNSRPRNTVPDLGQIVAWGGDGGRYRVMAVERLYDQRTLHHVEVDLGQA